MKTCKKCKKSVPNNMKICKYCGTDLSSVKPNNKKNKSTKPNVKKEVVEKKKNIDLEKTEILETKVLDLEKTEILETKSFEKIDENYEEKEELSSFNILENKEKNNKKAEDLTKAQQIYVVKKKIKKRKVNRFIFLTILILIILFLGIKFFNKIDDMGYIVNGDEKINEVTFNMGDVITYKDISYIITKVETSTGTAYKKPKAGNHYLIVSLSLENKSDSKHHYSGTYFTMLDGIGNETNRIISPVNAGEDLYSGDLVIGGKKEASLVFETKKEEKDLYLQYYDPDDLEKVEQQEQNEDNKQEEEEEIVKITPKFRVKIKVN